MSKRTHIGHLNRRIEIQRPESSRSPSGAELLTWTCVAYVWAAVSYARTGSGEDVEGDQLVATNRVIFTIRERSGLNEKMRLVYRDDIFNIMIIREIQGHYLELTAEKQI